jgi:hypothetical protein
MGLTATPASTGNRRVKTQKEERSKREKQTKTNKKRRKRIEVRGK